VYVYFGGRDGGNPPPKKFLSKKCNFSKVYRYFELKRHKNLRGRYRHPLGVTSPLKLFFDFWTRGCQLVLRSAHRRVHDRFWGRRLRPNASVPISMYVVILGVRVGGTNSASCFVEFCWCFRVSCGIRKVIGRCHYKISVIVIAVIIYRIV